MIAVTPGTKYFWRNGRISGPKAKPDYKRLCKWIRENTTDCELVGDNIVDFTCMFKHPEDALAFKLKFGI